MMITCEDCRGAGKLYKSRYGGNDPDVWCIGTCQACDGAGEVELTAYNTDSATDDELLAAKADCTDTDMLDSIEATLYWRRHDERKKL